MTYRVKWREVSRNERAASVNGRHYFACRCNPKRLWHIEELNQAELNGSRRLGVIETGLKTRQVSLWLINRNITG